MALFDVPGWSVPDAPISEPRSSRKRKHPSGKGDDRVHTAAINFEKLLEKLDDRGDNGRQSPKIKQKKEKKGAHVDGKPDKAGNSPARDRGKTQKGVKQKEKGARNVQAETSQSRDSLVHSQKRRRAAKGNAELKDGAAALPAASVKDTPKLNEGLTALQAGMKSSLDGARFRWINELLYKSDSEHAHELMRENPQVYEEYHTGFRHQVHSWPTNPVSHYVSSLSAYSQKTVIADLGCGDAALARALTPQGMTVLSFDLVSDGVYVVEADICGHLPLPGSESSNLEDKEGASEGEGAVVDVVVCALSLMGTNWPTCIREAWRILKPGGELKIAEVASRFTAVDDFVALVSAVGFRLKSKDDRNTHFTLFEFKKVARKTKSPKEWDKLVARGNVLKPCEYKRR